MIRPPRIHPVGAGLAAAAAALCVGAPALAELVTPPSPADFGQQVRQFALDAASAPGVRVEITLGSLDSRLRLAPCERVEPYLPAGTRLWGRSRIGLRCAQGATPWNVYLPVTVKVFARGLAAAGALPAGAVLTAADVRASEVDLAAAAAPLLVPESAVGRTLARPLAAGQTLLASDLRVRQWFAAGETVQITAIGAGFRVSSEGQALGPGLEGQPARVRTDSGKVVIGAPVGERRLELNL